MMQASTRAAGSGDDSCGACWLVGWRVQLLPLLVVTDRFNCAYFKQSPASAGESAQSICYSTTVGAAVEMEGRGLNKAVQSGLYRKTHLARRARRERQVNEAQQVLTMSCLISSCLAIFSLVLSPMPMSTTKV
mmetsp:Transcript_27832/g.59269  ORF Transcript_27832/g.59269 Transcript_27832/m.59269 type:complete len:133 (+) Transcript_27832:88-486(+)